MTQAGRGTVRTRPPLPIRSGSTQRPARCWTSSTWRRASSARRSAHPMSSPSTARSRNAFFPAPVGARRSSRASACSSQLPIRTPAAGGAFHLRDSGRQLRGEHWLSQASCASFRRAASRTLIVDGESLPFLGGPGIPAPRLSGTGPGRLPGTSQKIGRAQIHTPGGSEPRKPNRLPVSAVRPSGLF